MKEDKYIYDAYLNILKDNNIKTRNYHCVYLCFDNDVFIKLLSEYSKKINDRLNYLRDIHINDKYLYNFDSLMNKDIIPISYCIGISEYVKKINNKTSLCTKCSKRVGGMNCCIVNVDANDMNKYFNIYLNKKIKLR